MFRAVSISLFLFEILAVISNVCCVRSESASGQPILSDVISQTSLTRLGVIIPSDAVPGWKANFNGDIYPVDAAKGRFIAVVRMAREGYQKVKTNQGDRGYSLVGDYISDWGLFEIDLVLMKHKFIKILLASSVKLDLQIDRLEKLAETQTSQSLQDALDSINKLKGQPSLLPSTVYMEDPRFMEAYGQIYLVGTALNARQYSDPSLSPTYKMAALKVKNLSLSPPDIELGSFHYFGPLENKDSGFFPAEPNSGLYQKLQDIYQTLGRDEPTSVTQPVFVYLRRGGRMEVFPLAGIDDLFHLSDADFALLDKAGLIHTVLQHHALADKYQSVGWNNQPMALNQDLEGFRLVMFHATERQSFDPDHPELPCKRYVTYAGLMDKNAKIVSISELPIQVPEATYELVGDVNQVVFNSGNYLVPGADPKIILFNGTADSAFAAAEMDLDPLVDYLKKKMLR